MPEKVFASLREQLTKEMYDLREYITGQKLEGQVLKHRTGNLINSTQPSVSESGEILTGKVSVGPEAPYGRYQEYGAQIPERITVKARALHWINAAGADVFARRARAFYLQPHSFMRPSLQEQREQIIAGLQGALDRGAKS